MLVRACKFQNRVQQTCHSIFAFPLFHNSSIALSGLSTSETSLRQTIPKKKHTIRECVQCGKYTGYLLQVLSTEITGTFEKVKMLRLGVSAHMALASGYDTFWLDSMRVLRKQKERYVQKYWVRSGC